MRRLAFTGPQGRGWGVALLGERTGLLLATPDGPESLASNDPVRVEVQPAQDGWRSVVGDGVELRVGPVGTGVDLSADGVRASFARCEVTGSALGAEFSSEQPARGAYLEHEGWNPAGVDSVREMCAWFEEGVEYGVLALRPLKSKGHDRDIVFAALLPEPEAPPTPPVEDGRLSSTYTGDGEVRQAGLELWLAEGDDSSGEGDAADVAFPHRVAGERLASSVTLELDGLRYALTPFLWHSRGREGLGFYGVGGHR